MNQLDDATDPCDPHDRPGGLAGDVRQLKTHSSAAAVELREFLAQTRGRNVQEVLGMVAESRLMRSVALAALAAVLVLVAASVIPWLIGRGSPARHDTRQPTTGNSSDTETTMPRAATDNSENAQSVAQPLPDTVPSGVDAKKAVKAMGLDATKAADPKTNPLEHRLDDLLDKVK